MNPNDEPVSGGTGQVSITDELLEDLERLARPGKRRRVKELELNELPTGRRKDFRILFCGGNSLFLTAIIFCSQYLGGVGQLAVLSFWVFYNLMLVYVMYVLMSRY